MELKECRLKLAEERMARLKAESRLTEVISVDRPVISKCLPAYVPVDAVNGVYMECYILYQTKVWTHLLIQVFIFLFLLLSRKTVN